MTKSVNLTAKYLYQEIGQHLLVAYRGYLIDLKSAFHPKKRTFMERSRYATFNDCDCVFSFVSHGMECMDVNNSVQTVRLRSPVI